MKINFKNLCSGSLLTGALLCGVQTACTTTSMESQYASLPSYNGEDLELTVNDNGTHFRLWSPQAEAVRVYLYNTDCNSVATDSLEMTRDENGTWVASAPGQLYGMFYTFRINHNGK